jgi:hypothetical protein
VRQHGEPAPIASTSDGWQAVEKRRERWQNKARKGEKAEFTAAVNEHFEPLRNAVLTSAAAFQQPAGPAHLMAVLYRAE